MAAGLLVATESGNKPETRGSTDDSSVSSKSTNPNKLKERDTWQTKFDFLLAICGASVGLGNVWRFPYLCYKNGGGVFLIPYFTCVFLVGVPLFFLEVSVGQFMTESIVNAFGRMCPLLKGVGVTALLLEIFVCVYYNVIIAWTLYYIFGSFTSALPWASCGNAWNTESCSENFHAVTSTIANGSESVNNTYLGNRTELIEHDGFSDPATEYWQRKVLHISDGVDNPGPLKWDLVLCLLLAWVIVYLCICKGIKTSGKVMYVTATSPYVLLVILLIRGLTLEGAWDGIKFYLLPDWSRIMDPMLWTDAGTQVIFSYSIGHAKLVALGSYNAYKHNSYRDSLCYATVNSATSFLSGFVIFPVLGFMAQQNGLSIKDVAASGPGLAFIAYPKAVAQLPLAPFWSIMFFVCLLMLGLDTQFVGVEAFCTTIVDMWPAQLRRGHRREIFIFITCVVMFFCGLPMVTYGGMYVFLMFDYYMGSRVLLLVSFTQLVLISYIYGARRYNDNMRMMLGFDIGPYMKFCWFLGTPLMTLALTGLCFASIGELTYNKTYLYPTWSDALGWGTAVACLLFIPGWALYGFLTTQGTVKQRWDILVRPQLKAHQLRPHDDVKDLAKGEDPDLIARPNAGPFKVTDKVIVEYKVIDNNAEQETSLHIEEGGTPLSRDSPENEQFAGVNGIKKDSHSRSYAYLENGSPPV